MPDLLLEIRSEDIPAGAQDIPPSNFLDRILAELDHAGLTYKKKEPEFFVTPRRLAVIVRGLPASLPPSSSERKGPRISAPDKAIQGFLRTVGAQSTDELEVRKSEKGNYYVFTSHSEEKDLHGLLAEIILQVLHSFSWGKSMRWGGRTFRWIRPLRSILCVFDGEVVSFEIKDDDAKVKDKPIASGNETRGHPVMAPEAITVTGVQDYLDKMMTARVCLETERRRDIIRDGLQAIAKKRGVDLVENEGLIIETSGQVEWPVVLSGGIDARFMDLPEELLISVMRNHQQNFAFRNKKTGKLAPLFAVIADVEALDGGKAVIAGNEAVLRARFADAQFYWDADCRVSLEEHKKKSDKIVFYGFSGATFDLVVRMGDKVNRVEKLAYQIHKKLLKRTNKTIEDKQVESEISVAAPLLKSDLSTGTVREFPELQGIVGCYLAKMQLPDEKVARAIREHYQPMGPTDDIPSSYVGKIIAIADKLDTLIHFFSIGLQATGTSDSNGLRRAALGVLRIVLEGEIPLPLHDIINSHEETCKKHYQDYKRKMYKDSSLTVSPSPLRPVLHPLLLFVADRLKVHLRNSQGIPHDVVDSVLLPRRKDGSRGIDTPLRSARVAQFLTKFLNTDDGANLLAGYKRAANILRIEEKKDSAQYAPAPDSDLLREGAEKTLAKALEVAEKDTATTLDQDDFAAAMTALAKLRQPLDAFFDSVTVNDSDKNLRANRLKLLSQVRKIMHQVADFSRIEGGERKQS